MKHSPSWGCLDENVPFPGAKALLTHHIHAGLGFFCCCFVFFFFNLKECILDLFDVLCSENIQNCVENHASP